MKNNQRGFSGEADILEMIALAHASSSENLHVVDLPYRLSSWSLDDPENVGLWFDPAGQLLAWAVMQTPFWTIDYVYHPEAGDKVHRLILDWVEARARQLLGTPFGHPCWFVMVFSGQHERIHDLEGSGFAAQTHAGEDFWSKVLLQRPAHVPLEHDHLPAGFSIRPLAGENEVDAYVELHRAVFESKNMTSEWRMRTLYRPEYHPELDLVVSAPDGRLAAFCIGWIDTNSHIQAGQIEPLGVHQDYRHLGLGKAILSETLHRLYMHKVEKVFVETDIQRNPALGLYKSIGFCRIKDVIVYRKDYNDELSR